jgi:hypothetical protein
MFEVVSHDCELAVYVDEAQFTDLRGTFATSLTVVALTDGSVEILLAQGRQEPVLGESRTVALPFEGTGWVVGAECDVRVDGAFAPFRAGILPIPFFGGVSGDGRAEIIEAETRVLSVDRFSISDEGALRAKAVAVQNISSLRTLESTFDDGHRLSAPVASHLNAFSWECSVPLGATGLRIRKIYDRFHGRQRARVLVDGELAGWWYEPAEDRERRWAVGQFGIEEPLLRGKSSVRISIDPAASTPLWSVSSIEVLALMPRYGG